MLGRGRAVPSPLPQPDPFSISAATGSFFPPSKTSRTRGQELSLPGERSRVFPRFPWCAGGWLAEPSCSTCHAMKRLGQDWWCFTSFLTKIADVI